MKILITILITLSFLTATFAQQTLPSRGGEAQIENGSGTLKFGVDTSGGGTITPSGATLAIPAALTLTGQALTVGTALTTGSLAVTTNGTIGGTLAVTGATALAGAVTATSLVVTNSSTLTGGLIVGGGATTLKILSGADTLDFGAIATNYFADLTLTIAGAGTNSAVFIGAPPAISTNIILNGFVSATNTVTIRAFNNSFDTPVNPAAGSFRAVVFQF